MNDGNQRASTLLSYLVRCQERYISRTTQTIWINPENGDISVYTPKTGLWLSLTGIATTKDLKELAWHWLIYLQGAQIHNWGKSRAKDEGPLFAPSLGYGKDARTSALQKSAIEDLLGQ